MSASTPFDQTPDQFASVDDLAHALFESMTKTPKSGAQLSVRVHTGLKPLDESVLGGTERAGLTDLVTVPTIEMTVQDLSLLRHLGLTKDTEFGDAAAQQSARHKTSRPNHYFSLPEGIEPLQGKPHAYEETEVLANIRRVMVDQKRNVSLRAFPPINASIAEPPAAPPMPADQPPDSAVEHLVTEWRCFFKDIVRGRKISVYAFWAIFGLIIAAVFSAQLAQILIISAVCFLFGLCAHLAIEFLRDVAALAWGKVASLPKALPQAGLPLPLLVKALARKADFLTARPQTSPLSWLKWPLPGLKR